MVSARTKELTAAVVVLSVLDMPHARVLYGPVDTIHSHKSKMPPCALLAGLILRVVLLRLVINFQAHTIQEHEHGRCCLVAATGGWRLGLGLGMSVLLEDHMNSMVSSGSSTPVSTSPLSYWIIAAIEVLVAVLEQPEPEPVLPPSSSSVLVLVLAHALVPIALLLLPQRAFGSTGAGAGAGPAAVHRIP